MEMKYLFVKTPPALYYYYDGGGSKIGQKQREIFHFAFLGFHKRRDKKIVSLSEREREKKECSKNTRLDDTFERFFFLFSCSLNTHNKKKGKKYERAKCL